MSNKCRAFSKSKLGLEPPDNRQAFYAGWDAAQMSELEAENAALRELLREALETLTSLRNMCKSHPALRGRNYIDIGVQTNRTIDRIDTARKA